MIRTSGSRSISMPAYRAPEPATVDRPRPWEWVLLAGANLLVLAAIIAGLAYLVDLIGGVL